MSHELDSSVGAARADELAAVLDIIRDAALPEAGIAQGFPGGYVVARFGASIVGVAGLEVHGDSGLLRSVAVVPARRGAGLARRLVEHRLCAAREQQLSRVYLLTTSAADYFRRLGFRDTPRDRAPDALRRSPEFATLCPASAVCLVKMVGEGS